MQFPPRVLDGLKKKKDDDDGYDAGEEKEW